MYRISQFSKISGLTVKALRYYDEQDILKPTFRNEENQYRYYTDMDLKKAQLVKLLRSFDFSIMEIKDTLETVENEKDLTCILEEKIKHIETHILKEKEMIHKISSSISPLLSPVEKKPYQIDTVEIEEVFVASLRFVGKYTDIDTYIPLLYKAVKNNKIGKHFTCYYDEECVENADIELCIAIKKDMTNDSITCKMLPHIQAIHTIHYGSYETLYLAYRALFEYANTHHLNIVIPAREMYRKSPGMIFKGNPDSYVTEIFLPYKMGE